LDKLTDLFPQVEWTSRIYFGGLLDVPDVHGETRAQGPVVGSAYDLLTPHSLEAQRLGLQQALTAGRLIQNQGEVIISYDFAERFGVAPGDSLTFLGSTMYDAMSAANYAVAGVVRFGMAALDRGAIILDLTDARLLLDMENASGEIFGFLPDNLYQREQAEDIKQAFNALYHDDPDEYAPFMIQLFDQASMSSTIIYANNVVTLMIALLVVALSIVLWNTGVLGGIRRYNEFGIRLAMGELKGHIYRSLLIESLFIGVIGSSLGTLLGLALSLYLSKHGINYADMMNNMSLLIDPVVRSQFHPRMLYIGYIPGVISMLIGSALAGMAIYKRKTALLFKELG
ncbi:MAG: FtsX-like permease family protein, partial [Bacteroidetes bacterium]|nr:FtsX-like permease family protein [Bacteroidota bacterium]